MRTRRAGLQPGLQHRPAFRQHASRKRSVDGSSRSFHFFLRKLFDEEEPTPRASNSAGDCDALDEALEVLTISPSRSARHAVR